MTRLTFGFHALMLSFDITNLFLKILKTFWDLMYSDYVLNLSNDVFSKRHFRSFNVTNDVIL